MRAGRILLVTALVAALGGCGAPHVMQKQAPSEQLGGHFQAQLLTHNGTKNAVILAVREDNDNGFLKVCGLYVYGGGGDDFSRFQRGITDQNSYIEVGTDKDVKGVRLYATFLHPHVSEPGSPLDAVGAPDGPKPSLEKLIMDTKIFNLKADCVTTETPWRPGFAQARFVPNLVITTMTTTWIPVRR